MTKTLPQNGLPISDIQTAASLVSIDEFVPARSDAESVPVLRQLFGLDLAALVSLMAEIGERPYRGKQLSEALYRQRVTDLAQITTLPQALRDKLIADGWEVGQPRIAEAFRSVDGTERYLVQGVG